MQQAEFQMVTQSHDLASQSLLLSPPLRYYPNCAPIQYSVHCYLDTQQTSTLSLVTERRPALGSSLSIWYANTISVTSCDACAGQ
jgi:hypothetical protein